jgi:hypothetical protein
MTGLYMPVLGVLDPTGPHQGAELRMPLKLR